MLFQTFKLRFFVSTINWNDILFSIHQKLLWILSANLMQDCQFKYVLYCLCFFYPESFLFSAPTLHIKEWKGSCKEFLFVRLFFKSDNISRATSRHSSGKGIEEIYFRRKRMDRQFWRFDYSPVDLKFCGIRIMSKCLNCLIWLMEFSRIRGKFHKCYIPNISDSNIRRSLSSGNTWIVFRNAFAK